MREITIKVYRYEELDDEAKERAVKQIGQLLRYGNVNDYIEANHPEFLGNGTFYGAVV